MNRVISNRAKEKLRFFIVIRRKCQNNRESSRDAPFFTFSIKFSFSLFSDLVFIQQSYYERKEGSYQPDWKEEQKTSRGTPTFC